MYIAIKTIPVLTVLCYLIVVIECYSLGGEQEITNRLYYNKNDRDHDLLSNNQLERAKRIVGGEFVYDDAPWVSTLRRDGEVFCGATLISESHIITAAHCVHFPKIYTVDEIWISNYGDTIIREVKVARCHEEFDIDILSNDICIIELKEPVFIDSLPRLDVNNIGSLNITENTTSKFNQNETQEITELADTSPDNTVYAFGHGAASENNLSDTFFWAKKVELPLISNAECNEMYKGQVSDKMMCAGFKEGGKDSCHGDSGGPLTGNGLDVLVGIISWGDGCARPDRYGVYTRIHSHIDWIRSQGVPIPNIEEGDE